MSGDTLLRQWLMLRFIPRAPARKSTTEIAAYLKSEGYSCTTRTVQRDLEKLSSIFGYVDEPDGRTNYWFYLPDHRVVSLPSMARGSALALLLARDQLSGLIPPSTLKLLSPQFRDAEEILAQDNCIRLNQWHKRVRVVRQGPLLNAPRVSFEAQDAIYNALMDQRQCRVQYQALASDHPKEQVLHPLGLVLREGVLYIVATSGTFSDPRHYALHRVKSAEMLPEAAKVPAKFNLSEYVERTFHYPLSPNSIKLVMQVAGDTARHLQERALSEDQKVRQLEDEDDEFEITATVADTDELRWWILSFGEQIEVLKPVALRRDIASRVSDMAEYYEI